MQFQGEDEFALIPDAAHFNIVENPTACAAAIHDFLTSVNDRFGA